MARWGLSSWLVFVRCLQILGTLVSAILNGFLLVYIHVNKLGLSSNMFSLEIMVRTTGITATYSTEDSNSSQQTCVTLIYTAVVLLVQHTGRRHLRARTSLIATFVVGDVLLTGLMIAIISIMARAGVPSNCFGLTSTSCRLHFVQSCLSCLLTRIQSGLTMLPTTLVLVIQRSDSETGLGTTKVNSINFALWNEVITSSALRSCKWPPFLSPFNCRGVLPLTTGD